MGTKSYFCPDKATSQAVGARRLQAPEYKSCTYKMRCAYRTSHAMKQHRLVGGHLVFLEMTVSSEKSFRRVRAFNRVIAADH